MASEEPRLTFKYSAGPSSGRLPMQDPQQKDQITADPAKLSRSIFKPNRERFMAAVDLNKSQPTSDLSQVNHDGQLLPQLPNADHHALPREGTSLPRFQPARLFVGTTPSKHSKLASTSLEPRRLSTSTPSAHISTSDRLRKRLNKSITGGHAPELKERSSLCFSTTNPSPFAPQMSLQVSSLPLEPGSSSTNADVPFRPSNNQLTPIITTETLNPDSHEDGHRDRSSSIAPSIISRASGRGNVPGALAEINHVYEENVELVSSVFSTALPTSY